ncbi:2Fe-2S iron-sulfur cluster-binding protein [Acidiphilium iwatense]|uniref:2Fe-2S iron-sulfur cluster binding domain-containing protein n=1 Tax=Acidiphilium iwatense TaxID=768198 RepID=A0ABS9E172_9PROT|nr:2Fe-2S iron-sulfur cluster binding domain-containing protein [Acidiphilium iwatense]MCF3948751.1 2Fe-2S iron-sulfur cluster binding domain-containing protein [Acidiphilium iwatense]
MQVRITLKKVEHQFSAEPGERLLYAGLRHGVPLAYECATGTCGTCKAVRVTGTIKNLWLDAPGRPDHGREVEALLLCQSCAESDCTLDGSPASTTRPRPQTLPSYFEAHIAEIASLTADVCLLTLSLHRPFHFEAGQFVLFSVDNLSGFRAYSMVEGYATSRPSFIIKRKPGGAISDWVFERATAGAPLRLFGPLGVATLRPETDGDLFLLAGASGLSMAFSVLDAAARNGHLARHRADVIFGVRRAADLFLVDRLAATGAVVTLALSDEADVALVRRSFPDVRVMSGFVHEVAAACLPTTTSNTIAFLAGPPPMIDACLRHLVVGARIPPTRIRYDKFS